MVISEMMRPHLGLRSVEIIMLQDTKLVEIFLHRIGCHECKVGVNTVL